MKRKKFAIVSYTSPVFKLIFPFSRRETIALLGKISEIVKQACPSFNGKIELILANDKLLNALNNKFLNCPGPTNTLAFPATNDQDYGLLYLSVETFQREYLLYGQNKSYYAIRLLNHAVAHLAGYNHGWEMEKLCTKLEEEIKNL